MKAEHWHGPGSDAVFPTTHSAKDKAVILDPDEEFCCFIEGEDWEDVMKKFNEHKGWEPYIPMENK